MPIPPDLCPLVKILAQWAERTPWSKIAVFGSRVRGDSTPASDLNVALFKNGYSLSPAALEFWKQELSTDFAELKRLLGVPVRLHDEDDGGQEWAEIYRALERPAFQCGKVLCLITLAFPNPDLAGGAS